MGKINPRVKGHVLERRLAKLFRELGYEDCLTSRLESKRQDDLGIDLCHTGPFQVQAKANEKLGSAHAILAKMPQKKGKYNLVFHKKNLQGVVVSMTEQDFVELLKLLLSKKLV